MADIQTACIRSVKPSDAAAVTRIYNHYVLNSVATFAEQPLSDNTMSEYIQSLEQQRLPWLVAERDDQLTGYAYASPWKARSGYRYAVEISVYVGWEYLLQGLGGQLYQALFASLAETEVRTVIAGIALPNPGCVALHEKFGLVKVAHFKAVGYKFARWLDVGYWQKAL